MGSQNHLILPTPRLLQYYKNCIKQTHGINAHMLEWMVSEASSLPEWARSGCLSLDEIKIQPDLLFDYTGGESRLVGLADMGQYANDLHKLKTGSSDLQLSTSVLQFLFTSHKTGKKAFRFPVAQWPTVEATAPEIEDHLHQVLDALQLYGFTVDAILMDGSSNNRSFLKLLTNGKPKQMKYRMENRSTALIMDPSHLLKKIRNNVMKSLADESGIKFLRHKDSIIIWDHWIEAQLWDSTQNEGHRIHPKLSLNAVELDDSSKMRNGLAVAALNKNMLILMQEYREHFIMSEAQDELDGAIEFLTHTSCLCELFLSGQPLHACSDIRLTNAKNALLWFEEWESAINHSELSPKEKQRSLLSWETREDLQSAIIGFEELIDIRKNAYPGQYIIPGLINTDGVENFFCMQRCAHNGATTNPSYYQYCYSINAILLSDGLFRKGANAAGTLSAVPYCLNLPNPLNPRKSSG